MSKIVLSSIEIYKKYLQQKYDSFKFSDKQKELACDLNKSDLSWTQVTYFATSYIKILLTQYQGMPSSQHCSSRQTLTDRTHLSSLQQLAASQQPLITTQPTNSHNNSILFKNDSQIDFHYKMKNTSRARQVFGSLEQLTQIHSIQIWQLKELYKVRSHELKIDQTRRTWNNFLERFYQTTKKERFVMSDYGLSSESALIIADILKENFHFFILDLSKNTIGDKGASFIAEMLKSNKCIVSLILQNNNITSKGAALIAQSLLSNHTLTHFDFSSPDGLHRNRMQGAGAVWMKKVLQQNDQLTVVNMSCTSMTFEAVKEISEGLSKNQELVGLDLSFNSISTLIVKNQTLQDCHSGDLLFSSMHAPCKIRWLDVSNNNLTDFSMKCLGELIELNNGRSRVEKLNISNCQITSMGLEILLQFAEQNRHLQILQMNQNRFHQPAIESLKKYLKNNSILKHLEMRNCNLQPEAGDAIGTGLTKNNTLCRLYLGNNSLGNFGVVSLVSGIRTNESLRILDLKNNKFDTEGGKELLEYLIENKQKYVNNSIRSLEDIDLSQNMMTNICSILSIEFLKTHPNVKRFDIDKNEIEYDKFLEVVAVVERNQEIQRDREKPVLRRQLRELRKFTMPSQSASIPAQLEQSNKNLKLARDSLESLKQDVINAKERSEKMIIEMTNNFSNTMNQIRDLDQENMNIEFNIKLDSRLMEKKKTDLFLDLQNEEKVIHQLAAKVKENKDHMEKLEIIFKKKISTLTQTLKANQVKLKVLNSGYAEVSRNVLFGRKKFEAFGDSPDLTMVDSIHLDLKQSMEAGRILMTFFKSGEPFPISANQANIIDPQKITQLIKVNEMTKLVTQISLLIRRQFLGFKFKLQNRKMYLSQEMRMGGDYLSKNQAPLFILKDDQAPLLDTIQEFKWLPNIPNICAAATWEGLIRFYEVSNPRYDQTRIDCKHVIAINEPVISIDSSPDGKAIFAALSDFSIRAFEIQSSNSMILGSHETAPARHVFWVQEFNTLVSVGMDKRILFWDLRNSNMKPVFELPCSEIPLIAAQDLGLICYSDRKNTTYMAKWDYIKAPQNSMQRNVFQEFETQLKKDSQITSLAFNPDSSRKQIALVLLYLKQIGQGTVDGRVNLSSIDMNLKSQSVITFKAHKIEEQQGYGSKKPVLYPVSGLGFNYRALKNWMYSCGSDGNIIFWDYIQKNKIRTIEMQAPITCAAVSEDGKNMIFSTGYDWHKGMEQMGSFPNQVGVTAISDTQLYFK